MNSSEIVERLRGACVDWDGSEAPNGAEPIHPTSCGDLRRAADHIEAQDKLIGEWRAARAAFLALPAGSPLARDALNRLANAEDALYVQTLSGPHNS